MHVIDSGPYTSPKLCILQRSMSKFWLAARRARKFGHTWSSTWAPDISREMINSHKSVLVSASVQIPRTKRKNSEIPAICKGSGIT